MKKNLLFSIVIVNYNHGDYLENTIQSILSQSCKEFELIIIDGGSTDSSLDIIEKYHSNIAFWISEKDNGQSDAFNKGFKKANGTFCFWVNADDILLPDSLKLAKRYILSNPQHDWFVANTIYIDRNDHIIKCARGMRWFDFLIKNAPIYVYGPTSIFRKDLFERTDGFDESLHYTMDTDLWMRFKNMGYRFKRIPNYFWAFRIHENSKTSLSLLGKTTELHKKEQIRISKKNDHSYTYFGYLRQLLFKFLLGTYFSSFFDTIKFKGKALNKIHVN